MQYALKTYQKQPAEVLLRTRVKDFCLDLLSFWSILFILIDQKLFSDSNTKESHTNQTNLTGNFTEANISPCISAQLSSDYILLSTIKKFRRWMACMDSGRQEQKKFNEESNYHPFLRQPIPDSSPGKWRTRSIIHRIRREPAYCW